MPESKECVLGQPLCGRYICPRPPPQPVHEIVRQRPIQDSACTRSIHLNSIFWCTGAAAALAAARPAAAHCAHESATYFFSVQTRSFETARYKSSLCHLRTTVRPHQTADPGMSGGWASAREPPRGARAAFETHLSELSLLRALLLSQAGPFAARAINVPPTHPP